MEDREDNLYYYVLSQLKTLDLPPEVMAVGAFLVESLNGNGWLDESLEELAADSGYPKELLEQGLAAVQSLEPAGPRWTRWRYASWRASWTPCPRAGMDSLPGS